ncbi:MAG: D-glycero-beta-D-manno-heptose 1-phosphate adenylyltransferase [Marinifilaceae bacterium]
MNHLAHIRSKIILDSNDLATKLKVWRYRDEKIVFTNGCFDILHRGHVEYLAQAAALGGRLIVALNTDASIKRLKGEERPINNAEARALLMAALEFVDMVIFFDEDTPYEVISAIVPDILVKGSDYAVEDIVGYDIVTQNGGKVCTIDFVEGYSTTSIIEKSQK